MGTIAVICTRIDVMHQLYPYHIPGAISWLSRVSVTVEQPWRRENTCVSRDHAWSHVESKIPQVLIVVVASFAERVVTICFSLMRLEAHAADHLRLRRAVEVAPWRKVLSGQCNNNQIIKKKNAGVNRVVVTDLLVT